MSSQSLSPNPTYTANALLAGIHSFGVSLGGALGDAFSATTPKLKSPAVTFLEGMVGFGLGLGVHRIYEPLTERIVKFLGVSTIPSDPFDGLGLGCKILVTPLICVILPIIEEKIFRGDLQGALKDELKTFYVNLGLSDSDANIASRVTSVFFASVIFGLFHFTNAIVFWCNPVLFLPQVVAATIMGLVLSLAKEFSGGLHMPIGMHIGNNTLAWALNIKASL